MALGCGVRDTMGAGVTCTNATSNGSWFYPVFVTAAGKRAVVVINQEFEKRLPLESNYQILGA